MTDQELLYRMAIARLLPLEAEKHVSLLRELGSATAVYEQRHHLRDILSHSAWRVADALASMDSMLPRCEEELAYTSAHKIRILALGDADYPARLAEADDAPLLLYYLGKGNLNATHIVSVVGTRRCTERGRELCAHFAADLQRMAPDTLIVSGLAYGIDIAAHRAALAAGLPTVGVLAHGLDQVYPRMHRDTAIEMLRTGGLLTEYMSHTTPEKVNFVQRNRIVAAMSDAVVVVESAARGGSLITAELAFGYSRDVFAFPGRPSDAASAGCNTLIRSTKATLIQSAADFVESMGWEVQPLCAESQQTDLFPNLTPDERAIVSALHGTDGLSLTQLCETLALPVASLMSLLSALEMRGIISTLPGNRFCVKR